MAIPTPPPSQAPGKASRDRRLLALVATVLLAALVTLGWQMRPAGRGILAPTPPQVFAPAPPWAAVASSPHTATRAPRWPVSSGDGSVRFVDVAQKAGIRYQWSIPGPRPLDILQTIGNGCALLDYDRSGNLSALLIGTDHVALFKGDGHGHFTDVSHATGLPPPFKPVSHSVGRASFCGLFFAPRRRLRRARGIIIAILLPELFLSRPSFRTG